MAHADYDPQLATLVKEPPSGDRWIHEIKYDGYRIGCVIGKGRVRLISRNGKDWTSVFPEIAEAAKKLKVDEALLDGEVAMVMPDGKTSFEALQQAAAGAVSHAPLVYFVFDLMRLGRERIAELPLEERKKRLRKLVGGRQTGRIRYAEHIEGRGDVLFDHATRLGLEGIISKRRDLSYRPGRHDTWRKTKVMQRRLFVIGGFTDPEGTRAGIGALLLGVYDGSRLVFAGRAGTGFSHAFAVELRTRLDAIEQRDCPFDPPLAGPDRHAHWVQPKLVCDVTFVEWTDDGRLRHPSFQGLRSDVKAKDVKKEEALGFGL
ncbi:MAG TPA: non-homologous end-joining DNA ligase [Vicinamibacterales bacterium]|nr:non-homologous end-joining DNA ligase [Vicinamibacterales bacterium]